MLSPIGELARRMPRRATSGAPARERLEYERLADEYVPLIEAAAQREKLESLTDAQLRNVALELRARTQRLLAEMRVARPTGAANLAEEIREVSLQELPLAYALAREVSKRLLKMEHYKEQLVAGVALHLGAIAEMQNGEGKTVTLLLPAYLNALFARADAQLKEQRGRDEQRVSIHILTTNDYLARRDYTWLKPAYEFLGVTVGYIQDLFGPSTYSMGDAERRLMYSRDVVYGSSKEVIFDYLRDNVASSRAAQVQSAPFFVIVDEADHVLLDEAQTPHLIAGKTPTMRQEDVGLIYLTDALVGEMVSEPLLIAPTTSGERTMLAITSSGRKVLQVLTGRFLDQFGPRKPPPDWAPPLEVVLAVAFQFADAGLTRHAEDLPELKRLTHVISSSTAEPTAFYDLDSDGRVIGLSSAGREVLTQHLTQAFLLEPDPFFREFEEQLPKWFTRLLVLLLRQGAQIYAKHLEEFGLTVPEFLAMLPRRRTLAQELFHGFLSPRRAVERQAKIIVDLLSSYLSDAARYSFEEAAASATIVGDLVALMDALRRAYPDEVPPPTVARALSALRVAARARSDEPAAEPAAAVARLTEAIFMPVVRGLMLPTQQLARRDQTTVVLAIALRVMADAAAMQQPKTVFEREMGQLMVDLGRILTNRLFEHVPERKLIRLTRWGELLLDDYVQRIAAAGMWTEGGRRTERHVGHDLRARMRFLVHKSLEAHLEFRRDNEYLVQTKDREAGWQIPEVVIVDHLTGRAQPGRRWKRYLHAFIEAKEGLPVEREKDSVAVISTNAYIKRYPKCAGITATAHIGLPSVVAFVIQSALSRMVSLYRVLRRQPLNVQVVTAVAADPVETEFENVYGMPVVQIPTHSKRQRSDRKDLVYKIQSAAIVGAVDEAVEAHQAGRPVLIETNSVKQSEEVALLLRQSANLHGQVPDLLNARTDEMESLIISRAGLPGAITVSTQIAGRGTDIIVAPEALAKDGLFVVGIQRRLSRRWDNQILGRTGRQGETGSTLMVTSLDSDLMQRFGGSGIARLMERLGLEDDVPLEHDWVTTAIANSQIKVEDYARRQREETAGYDGALQVYRDLLYELRQATLRRRYPCPACHEILVEPAEDEAGALCATCAEIDITGAARPPLWRDHFRQLVTAAIDGMLRTGDLPTYLVKKYAHENVPPKRWQWGLLRRELNQYVAEPVSRSMLQRGIEMGNELYPAREQRRLDTNIRSALHEQAVVGLMTTFDRWFEKYRQDDRELRDWDFRALASDINRVLRLDLLSADLASDPSGSPQHTRDGVRTRVLEAARRRVSDFSWPREEGALIELITYFNQVLDEKHWLKLSQDQDRLNPLLAAPSHIDVRAEVLDHIADGYNSVLARVGPRRLFEFEDQTIRELIDSAIREFLRESELLVEELSGWSAKERLDDYALRLAMLFERSFWDLAREAVRIVLKGPQPKEPDGTLGARGVRRSSFDRCACGSGQAIRDCCGQALYAGTSAI